MRLCRSTVAERQLNGTQHSLFIVMQNERQYLHHLPVAPGLLEKMLLQPPEPLRQFRKRRAVTQGARFSLDHRQVVAPVIDGPARLIMRPQDDPRVFANDLPFSNDNDAIRINPYAQRETPDNDVPKLGLTLAPGSKVAGADGNGVIVTAVDPDGVAADHGFQVGDVILDVSGKSVSSPSDVRKELADARKQGKHTLLFRVKSGEGTHFVALPLGSA